MPQVAVDAAGHEYVSRPLLAPDQVAEIRPRVHHRRRPRRLPQDQHRRADDQPDRLRARREPASSAVAGEEAVVDEAFGEGEPVRGVVGAPVAGKEEGGGRRRGGRVRDGGGVVFEEVEEGEEGEEGGEAPEGAWVRGQRGELDGREEGGGEGGAEGEGAEGDGGGGAGDGGGRRSGGGAVGVVVVVEVAGVPVGVVGLRLPGGAAAGLDGGSVRHCGAAWCLGPGCVVLLFARSK